MMDARYIGVEEWKRDWDPLLDELFGNPATGACTNLSVLNFEIANQIPEFRDPGWKIAVIPGDCLDLWFGGYGRAPKKSDIYDPFDARDEFESFFKTMELLDLTELVVTETLFRSPGDVDPNRAGYLCAATREGLNQKEFMARAWRLCAFDRSLRWCMASGFEFQTVLFGDVEFMNTYYEASGGKQAVIDRMITYVMSDEWEDERPTKGQELFKILGWNFDPEPHLNSEKYLIWRKVQEEYEEAFENINFEWNSPEYDDAEAKFYREMETKYGPPKMM